MGKCFLHLAGFQLLLWLQTENILFLELNWVFTLLHLKHYEEWDIMPIFLCAALNVKICTIHVGSRNLITESGPNT